jgi:cytochrome c biogenesis protein CcdA
MGEFAWPFGLGILAAFNPCGFAMLPAYLSYFLGLESTETTPRRLPTVVRGLAVGIVMTLGFTAVFGTAGVLFATVINQSDVFEYLPYVIIAVGVLLIPLGVMMLLGRQVTLRLPKMSRGTGSRSAGSVFMFGVSYAVVSLSCTIGLFIPAVSNSFTTDGIATGTGNFIAYAVGMGMVITFLTMSLALAKSNVAANMRRILPWITPVSGAVLVLAGVYMIDYGIWDYHLTVNGDASADNLLVDHFLEFQTAVSDWIQDASTERIGLLSLMGIVGILLVAWRDDLTDRVQRASVTTIYALVYLFIEIRNDGEFLFLPMVRFLANWPERIAHWFTDPLRLGVPLEIAFVALVAWIVARRVRRYRPSHAPGVVGAS